jgi:tellurite resistance protein TerC
MMQYWPVIAIVLQLIFLEGILSIDNAAVLGALVAPLPNNRRIPWPTALQKLGAKLDPMLGNQRAAALRVGLLGAYIGRGLMLLVAGFLIHNSWVRLVGAAYLIRLAFDELGDATPGEETEEEKKRTLKATSFWAVVATVELMDLVFSIDNVIAAVSLSDELWVVMVGVGIGILTMRFAAGIFSYAVEREPILKQAAYILVLNIGIQLILEQIWNVDISDLLRFAISIAIIVISLAYAHIPVLQRLEFLLKWLSQGMGIINDFVDWLFIPFKTIFERIFRNSSKKTTPENKL